MPFNNNFRFVLGLSLVVVRQSPKKSLISSQFFISGLENFHRFNISCPIISFWSLLNFFQLWAMWKFEKRRSKCENRIHHANRKSGIIDANNLWMLSLTISWRMTLLQRNHSIDLLCKSTDWFLDEKDLCCGRVNYLRKI